MKKVIVIFAAIVSGFVLTNLGAVIGGLVIAFGIVVGVGVWSVYLDWMKRQRYERMYEDIMVATLNPKTGERYPLPEEIEHLVVWAEYGETGKVVREEKKMLENVENPFFVDPNLSDLQRLKVFKCVKGDGEWVNETWEEYGQRLIREVMERRAERHKMLKRLDQAWYEANSNGESVIELG